MAIAPAIALLVRHGLRAGYAPYAKSLLALVFLCPLFVRVVAEYTFVPLTPALLVLLYWSSIRPVSR